MKTNVATLSDSANGITGLEVMIELLKLIVAGLMVFIALVLIETIFRLRRASKGG
jgi:hypothetical protein